MTKLALLLTLAPLCHAALGVDIVAYGTVNVDWTVPARYCEPLDAVFLRAPGSQRSDWVSVSTDPLWIRRLVRMSVETPGRVTSVICNESNQAVAVVGRVSWVVKRKNDHIDRHRVR